MGATDSNDGQSTYAWPSNVSNVPIELIERDSGLFVVGKALRPGSGGAGRQRGGLGQEVEFEVISETPVGIILMAERCRFAAAGIEGGKAGARGEVLIDGVSVDYRKTMVLKKGQRILLRTPGGGGVGNPSERDPMAVDSDRREGYTGD